MESAIRIPLLLRRAVSTGMAAGLASTLVLLWRGRKELDSPAAPVNAPAHWIDHEGALRNRQFSVGHTAGGLLIHHAMSVFWAFFYEAWRSRRPRRSAAGLAAGAAGVTAVAAWVDLRGVPQKLTPGFEKHLSARGLCWVYGAFAIGLMLRALHSNR